MIHERKCSIQQGFTLLEVLVAVTISLLIISVASTFYQRTVRENQKIQSQAMLKQTDFLVSNLLVQQVRQAGFRAIDTSMLTGRLIPVPDKKDLFPAVEDAWLEGQFLKAADNILSFRFSGSSDADGNADGSMVDCSGNPVAADAVQEISLSLIDEAIVCNSGAIQEVLLGGAETIEVSRFDISLGLDDGDDGSIDRYVAAGSATDADFELTREVMMRVLMVSRRSLDALGQKYFYNDTEHDYPDNHYRRELVVRADLAQLTSLLMNVLLPHDKPGLHGSASCRQQRGFALLATLVIVMIAGVLLSATVSNTRDTERTASNAIQFSRAMEAAEGGAVLAQKNLASMTQTRVFADASASEGVFSRTHLEDVWWDSADHEGQHEVEDGILLGVATPPRYTYEEIGEYIADGGTGIVNMDIGGASYGKKSAGAREHVLYRIESQGVGSKKEYSRAIETTVVIAK